LGLWRMRYKIIGNPLVSIIIPTKDKYECISKCLSSIIKKTTYKNYEIIIVDTGSTNKKVFKLYEQIKSQRFPLTVLHWHKEFNFSAVCNLGAQQSRGEYLLFLNNDTEVISDQWLEVLVGYAQLPHIGAVGCKLLYPSHKIQHSGIIFDPKNKIKGTIVPDHAFKNYEDNADYQIDNSSLYGAKNYLAVTAACLVIERAKFDQAGGFNEDFKMAFNDVDLCLKLTRKNLFNVSVNWIKLLHHESVSLNKPGDQSRDTILFQNELKQLHFEWSDVINKDPFVNYNYW